MRGVATSTVSRVWGVLVTLAASAAHSRPCALTILAPLTTGSPHHPLPSPGLSREHFIERVHFNFFAKEDPDLWENEGKAVAAAAFDELVRVGASHSAPSMPRTAQHASFSILRLNDMAQTAHRCLMPRTSYRC